jgi:hypothetical protein
MKNKTISIASMLVLFNAILLAYNAWVKYNSNCLICGQAVALPINSVAIALVGCFSSLILYTLVKALPRYKLAERSALILATGCACVSIYLQIFQFRWQSTLCYLCLAAAGIYLVVLFLLLYAIVWLPGRVKG